MVSNRILSRYQGPPPPPDDGDGERCLGKSQPLHSAEEVAAVLKASPSPHFGSRRCEEGWQELMETLEAQDEPMSFTQFILDAMRSGRWRQAVWCQNNKGFWFAADVWLYEFPYGRYVGRVWKEFVVTYYLKFAITKAGLSVYMLSCHPSRG